MINYTGLVYQSRFIAELRKLHSVSDQIEIGKHTFIPDCWCFTSQVTNRSIQLKLVGDGVACDIDYINPAGVNVIVGVYDAENVAARTIAYLRKITNEI